MPRGPRNFRRCDQPATRTCGFASVAQQALAAGLADEVVLHVAPTRWPGDL
jgi:hypothetical protein